MSPIAYVALGSNVGDRAGALAFARASIGCLPNTRLLASTAVEETAPFGVADQPPFLNQMLAVATTLTPELLLDALQRIERLAGRSRDNEVRWGPRRLDCDIVLFDDLTISTPRLTVPHPGVRDRDFWRRELAELGVRIETPRAVTRPPADDTRPEACS